MLILFKRKIYFNPKNILQKTHTSFFDDPFKTKKKIFFSFIRKLYFFVMKHRKPKKKKNSKKVYPFS